ncbi:MAG: NAD(P)H-hydrate dehydratase [Coriobacteriales bacterium]|jgi:hydroxyethylthiazole kinase-like uncharacterized protein yjeF
MGFYTVEWDEQKYSDLVMRVDEEASKYTRGSLLVIGGSAKFTGAPILSSIAAAKAGAGYVSVMVPKEIEFVARCHLLSIPVIPAPSRIGMLQPGAVDTAKKQLNHLDAVVLGPGMGTSLSTAQITAKALREFDVPVLLDADGLNVVAGRHLADQGLTTRRRDDGNDVMDALVERRDRGAATVLTPHDGELKRLSDACIARGQEAPEGTDGMPKRVVNAAIVSAHTGAIVVAKGHQTYVVREGSALKCPVGTQALAKAGTGDVLSGAIGSFLAQGLPTFGACALGVRVHAIAGSLAEEKLGMAGVMAEDVMEAIPSAIMKL